LLPLAGLSSHTSDMTLMLTALGSSTFRTPD
jgi:hypothetical protein